MIGKPIRKEAIYKATRLCRMKQRKTEGEETKDRQEQNETVQKIQRRIVTLFPRSRKSPRLLGQPRQFRNTRLSRHRQNDKKLDGVTLVWTVQITKEKSVIP